MSRRTAAILSLILVMSVWGSAFSVTKAAVAETPPVLIAFLRSALSAALLLPLTLLPRRASSRLSRRQWVTVAAMGICGFTLFQAGANIAQTYTSATQAAIIQSIIPLLTAILAALVLREHLSARRMAGIALSLLGVVVVVLVAAPSEQAKSPLLGGAIMLGAVSMWAVYTILAKYLAGVDLLQVTAYSTAFGALALLPLALLESRGLPLLAISASGWLSIAYLGAVSSAATNLLYNRSLGALEANQTAAFINLVPIVGVLVAVVVLGEPLIGWQLAGGAVTLVGVWLAT